MTPKWKTRFKVSFLLGVAGAIYWSGLFAAPRIAIENRSGVTLHNVVLSGNGFSMPVADLAPGASTEGVVHPKGDSSLAIAFDAGGQRYEQKLDAYIEAHRGYQWRLLVDSKYVTTVARW